MEMGEYETLKIEQSHPKSPVFNLNINRPKQRNSLSSQFFKEFPNALKYLDLNPDVKVIILGAAGDHFCAGIDLNFFNQKQTGSLRLLGLIKEMQSAITALEECRKPVIAAIHGACIGGGVDIITACDLRYCTEDAFFSVKEVDLAMIADLGTLQRLPGIVGYGNAMELALTARTFHASEAKQLGLVSQLCPSKSHLHHFVLSIALEIAAKSPGAVTGTKTVLQKSRDLSLDQGLDYVASWNSVILQSDDVKEATSAFFQKRKPVFAKL